MQKEAESLFGKVLPSGVQVIQFEVVPHTSTEKKPYDAYLCVQMTENQYLEYVRRLGLYLNKEGNNSFSYLLPGELKNNRFTPTWWSDSLINSEFLAAGEFRKAENHGGIVSAYENNYGYFKAFENAK